MVALIEQIGANCTTGEQKCSAETTLAYYIQSVEESRRVGISRLEERIMPAAISVVIAVVKSLSQ